MRRNIKVYSQASSPRDTEMSDSYILMMNSQIINDDIHYLQQFKLTRRELPVGKNIDTPDHHLKCKFKILSI